jgi:predicted phage-related endonuclease
MSRNNADQRTAAWLLERAGHATASCFVDIVAVGAKGQPLKAREDYLMKLVVERITGQPVESAGSMATAWGTDCEPFARAEYEAQSGNIVKEVGFAKHPSHAWVGASADGLTGRGGIEIKSPFNSAVHLGTWRDGMPEAHKPQVFGVMWVLDLEWMDFCSYDPRMPPELRLYVQRIERDETYIAELEKKVLAFLDEVQGQVDLFHAMGKAA